MEEKRCGRQMPTTELILPYENTEGDIAVELYETSGRTAILWQKQMISDILAFNDEGLWMHTKFGFSVPRRNGKNEVVVMREFYGLVERGEHILHTAHRTTTTHAAWERLLEVLKEANIAIGSSYRAFGKEHIELENGGKIEFRTRTSTGGLGEGFDLLVIDEAQEYKDDHESTLKYVVSDSENPQTIFCGTPPTAVSSGTVFVNMRKNVLAGETENTGWAEWSVEKMTDPKDREAWYETNPSLGYILTERKIADEIGSDETDFNIQRLGLWIAYNQKSAISVNEWEALRVPAVPELMGKMFVGIKYGHTGDNVAMSIALKTKTGKIFIESIDCCNVRGGNAWIIKFLRSAAPAIAQAAVDGANGQNVLTQELKAAHVRAPKLPTVKEIITANAMFEQGLFAADICHMGQPSLMWSATNCEKRAIGSAGGFGYRSIAPDTEIALLESAILAYWLAKESKNTRTQKVAY